MSRDGGRKSKDSIVGNVLRFVYSSLLSRGVIEE